MDIVKTGSSVKFIDSFKKIIILGGFFFCTLLALQLAFIVYPSAIFSLAAFIVFGLFVCAMAHYIPFSLILLLPYIFFRATTLLSGIAIESGGHMSDLGIDGQPTGAYIRLTAVYILFCLFAALIIEKVRHHFKFDTIDFTSVTKRTNHHPWVWIFFIFFIGASLYVLSIGFLKGFPLFEGFDRFKYLEIGGRGFAFYMGNRIIAAFLFGLIIYTCVGLRRYLGILLFTSMIIISVLFGEKFTSIMLIMIYVLTPAYLMNKKLQQRIIRTVIPYIIFISILTIPIILVVYGWSDNRHEAIERLTLRMVGQGELWYIADLNTPDAFRFRSDDINHIITNTVSPSGADIVDEYPYIGAYYFMHSYMPPGLLNVFLNQTYVTLTFAFEPYLLEIFGWFGMIFPLLFYSGIYALFLSYLAWAILNARPLSIFLAAKLLIWVVVGLAQGYLYAIFGFRTLLLVGIIIIYEAMSHLLSRKAV